MIALLRDRWLAWTLLAGLLLRCAAVPLVHQLDYTSDEREYITIAKGINEGKGFVDSNGTVSIRAPLYPFILAGILRVDPGLAFPHLLNAFLGALVILQTYSFALRLGAGRDVARWGGLIAGFTPGLVIYSALLQTEALGIFCFFAALNSGARMLERPGWEGGAWTGLWLGCAALTRAIFLPFGILTLLVFAGMSILKRKRTATGLLLAALLFFAVLFPWGVRNYAIHHAVIPVSTYGGTAFLIGNNPYADGTPRLREEYAGWFAAEVEMRRGVLPEDLTEAERSEVSRELGMEFVREHPGKSFLLALRKLQVMSVYPITNTASVVPFQVGVAGIELLIGLLAALGIALTSRPRAWVWMACTLIVLFLLLHVMLHGDARYRLPVTPLIAMLAGGGVSAFGGGFHRPSRSAAIAGAVVALGLIVGYGITGWMFIHGSIN